MIREIRQEPKPLSEEQFREILANSGIEYRAAENLPEKGPLGSGVRGFPPRIQTYLASMRDSCIYYLSWPTLIDTFKTHDARRTWRNQKVKEFGPAFNEHYEHNKLKSPAGNMVAYFEGLIGLLEADKVHTPLADELRSLYSEMPDKERYNDEMPLEDKLRFIEEVDAKIRTFLELVSKES